MTTPIIELQNINKSFAKHPVLHNLHLSVEQGKTYAFLGRNGAGKTTTIRLLMGLLKPDAGSLRVLGLDPTRDAHKIRQQVGYLAEDQQMWPWMKIREILRFMAPFYPTWDTTLAQKLLTQFALPPEQKIKTLSKGQNIRLGLLLALAHRPQLMILDDPALGLDPIMRKEFLRDVVEHLQGNNITVFFSSHLLYEVEPVADIIGILHHGHLATEQPTDLLRENTRQLTMTPQEWNAISQTIPKENILDIKPDAANLAITLANFTTLRPLLAHTLFTETELNLDNIFEAYVIGNPQNGANPSGADVPVGPTPALLP